MRNGATPEAPNGGHNSHAGTLLEGTAVALPGEPLELLGKDAEFNRALPGVLGGAPVIPLPDPDVEPVLAAPEVDPFAAAPVVVAEFD